MFKDFCIFSFSVRDFIMIIIIFQFIFFGRLFFSHATHVAFPRDIDNKKSMLETHTYSYLLPFPFLSPPTHPNMHHHTQKGKQLYGCTAGFRISRLFLLSADEYICHVLASVCIEISRGRELLILKRLHYLLNQQAL